jgi:hypothetical protein
MAVPCDVDSKGAQDFFDVGYVQQFVDFHHGCAAPPLQCACCQATGVSNVAFVAARSIAVYTHQLTASHVLPSFNCSCCSKLVFSNHHSTGMRHRVSLCVPLGAGLGARSQTWQSWQTGATSCQQWGTSPSKTRSVRCLNTCTCCRLPYKAELETPLDVACCPHKLLSCWAHMSQLLAMTCRPLMMNAHNASPVCLFCRKAVEPHQRNPHNMR